MEVAGMYGDCVKFVLAVLAFSSPQRHNYFLLIPCRKNLRNKTKIYSTLDIIKHSSLVSV